MSIRTVMLVGHDPSMVEAIASNLRIENCEVHGAGAGEQGIERARTLLPDVIIASDGLSDADLLRLCRQLRTQAAEQHVAMLAVISNADVCNCRREMAVNGHVKGDGEPSCEATLSDAIEKWLQCVEVVRSARDRIVVDELDMDQRRHAATLAGQDLKLTLTEFRLLWALAKCPGHVYSRRQLSELCHPDAEAPDDRTIDAHIKSIRRKLGERADLIETVRGVGYRVKSAAACPSMAGS